jgi:acyl-CoA dehydrogenase family protein 9
MIFSYALTEPRIGSEARHIETTATLASDGTHYLLNGQKAYITNANYAGGLTVFAQLDPVRPGFMGAFIVETAWDGVSVGKEMPKMGLRASSTAPIGFRNVHVPVGNLVGSPGDGFKIAMSVLNYGRLGLGAASTALLKVSTRDMLSRASSRVQFQVPIKSFQLVQEKIVRAEVNTAVSSAMNRFVARILHEKPFQNTAIETSHCKLFGTTRAWDAVYDGLQVAGGAGYLKTHPYEKRIRDFRVATVFEGTTEIHSIYPALFGLRRMAEWLTKSERGPFGKVIDMLKSLTRRAKWPLSFKHVSMRRALKEAKRNARLLRILFAACHLIYGRTIARGRIAEREYLLRRIGNLSLYLFGLMALLSDAAKKEASGKLQEKDLKIIDYFAFEAKEVRNLNRHFFDSKKEKLGAVVFHKIDHRS